MQIKAHHSLPVIYHDGLAVIAQCLNETHHSAIDSHHLCADLGAIVCALMGDRIFSGFSRIAIGASDNDLLNWRNKFFFPKRLCVCAQAGEFFIILIQGGN